jgi:hypothetical protein
MKPSAIGHRQAGVSANKTRSKDTEPGTSGRRPETLKRRSWNGEEEGTEKSDEETGQENDQKGHEKSGRKKSH